MYLDQNNNFQIRPSIEACTNSQMRSILLHCLCLRCLLASEIKYGNMLDFPSWRSVWYSQEQWMWSLTWQQGDMFQSWWSGIQWGQILQHKPTSYSTKTSRASLSLHYLMLQLTTCFTLLKRGWYIPASRIIYHLMTLWFYSAWRSSV